MEQWISDIVANGTAWLATMGISVGSILALLIVIIKNKAKKFDADAAYALLEAQLHDKYAAEAKVNQELLVAKMDSLEKKLLLKVAENDNARKDAINKQSTKLTALIDEAKAQTNIDIDSMLDE